MDETRLSFTLRKYEVQRHFRTEFQTDPLMRLITDRKRDTFGVDGIQNVHTQSSERTRSWTNHTETLIETLVETYGENSRKARNSPNHSWGRTFNSPLHLKVPALESYIPKLVHVLNEDDLDQRVQLYILFWHKLYYVLLSHLWITRTNDESPFHFPVF